MERDALAHLTQVFNALMPAVAGTDPPLEVAVDPLEMAAAGVGGIVGLARDPPGEIRARRVRAVARVRVRTTSAGALDAAVTKVTAAVVAGDRSQQRVNGMLEAALEDIGPETKVTAAGAERFMRDVRFRVLFEHLELPIAGAERVIATIPLASLAPPPGETGFRIQPSAAPPVTMAELEIFDAVGTKDGPSAWSYDPVTRRFAQASAIWGGNRAFSVTKAGTYAIVRAGGERGPFGDVRLEALLSYGGTGAVGLIFRWRDPDNFYFVVLQREMRLVGKRALGAFSSLKPSATQRGRDFNAAAVNRVTVTMTGARIALAVDDEPVLTAEDRSLTAPGRVGFLCHNENKARFELVGLSER